MRVQVTLTPSEAKRIIAKGIAALPEVRAVLSAGRILLKGGTTVSALAEELTESPLRISGRISARGTLAAVNANPEIPHSILLEDGRARGIDDDLAAAVRGLGPGDIIVIGANAIDGYGGAAMMAGAEGGAVPGAAWGSLTSEGAQVIIAAGLEKLIPGTIAGAVRAAGRKGVFKSTGMAVGLLPLCGRIVTEKDALEILADVRVTVIGAGGIFGGAGSTVLAVEGEAAETEKIFDIVLSVKGSGESCSPDSEEECTGPNPKCAGHLSCIFKYEGAGRKI